MPAPPADDPDSFDPFEDDRDDEDGYEDGLFAEDLRDDGDDGEGDWEPDTDEDSLRGRVLVAGRHLRDPNFFRSLVLIVDHGRDGAMGLVMNRPTGVDVAEALAGHIAVDHPDAARAAVYCGGPVEPRALFVVHNSVEDSGGELPVAGGLFVGNSRGAFERIVDAVDAGADGTRYRVFLGCAGWGPGQLEDELARGDWRLIEADTLLAAPAAGTPADPLFGPDPYGAWDAVAKSLARPPHVPGFPHLPGAAGDHRWN